MRALPVVTGVAILAACAAPAATPASAPITERRVMISGPFSPKTDAASIAAFSFEVAPVDTGGECYVTKTGGNGATMVMASYPGRTSPRTTMSITFDSAGHVVRFNDHRQDRAPIRMPGATREQADSIYQVQQATTRSSNVSFDYVLDQAVATNMGAGQPTVAILGSVRAFEKLARLGPPVERMARMRRLCGV